MWKQLELCELTWLDELASIVLDTASDGIAPILGSPLSITGFWLVHQFPSRAPPTYTQSGYVFVAVAGSVMIADCM